MEFSTRDVGWGRGVVGWGQLYPAPPGSKVPRSRGWSAQQVKAGPPPSRCLCLPPQPFPREAQVFHRGFRDICFIPASGGPRLLLSHSLGPVSPQAAMEGGEDGATSLRNGS